MIVHGPDVALVPLSVPHRLHFPLDRLIQDLAVRLAQPVAVSVDALLTGFAVLPHLIPLRYAGHTQAVGQDRLDIGLVRQAVGKAHHNLGAFLGKRIDAHLFATGGQWEWHAGQDRQLGVWLAVPAHDFDVDRIARPEVVTDSGAGRGVGHPDNPGKAWQVLTAGEFGELSFYAPGDCVVHRMAIWLSMSATLVMRSPWLIVAPGRNPGRAAIIALWLPW